MMMGFGFFLMLVVLAVPILLVLGVVILMLRPILNRAGASGGIGSSPSASAGPQNVCSRCGARLQADWLHCPQCGAPANG
jgi:preprotein translocase subunit SecG